MKFYFHILNYKIIIPNNMRYNFVATFSLNRTFLSLFYGHTILFIFPVNEITYAANDISISWLWSQTKTTNPLISPPYNIGRQMSEKLLPSHTFFIQAAAECSHLAYPCACLPNAHSIPKMRSLNFKHIDYYNNFAFMWNITCDQGILVTSQ